jgi:hypothetical protein
MWAKDRRALEGLADKIEVWRGCKKKSHIQGGLSWTVDKDGALWFARRFAEAGYLGRGVVLKEKVWAYLGDRKESEIVTPWVKDVVIER